MGKFNLGDFLNKEIFNQRQFKDITHTISNIAGRVVNFSSTMMNNMLKMSTNLSNWMEIGRAHV